MARIEYRPQAEIARVEELLRSISANADLVPFVHAKIEADRHIARSSKMNSLRFNKKRGTLG